MLNNIFLYWLFNLNRNSQVVMNGLRSITYFENINCNGIITQKNTILWKEGLKKKFFWGQLQSP